MLFANVCEGFISSCYGEYCKWRFWVFLVSFWCFVRMENTSLAVSPCYAQDLGYSGVPPAGHALWVEVGGCITFVTSGENT